jgi:hypothetical protein
MKFLYLLFTVANCSKIIKNINVPSCKNCIYFNPPYYTNDFTSSFSTCEKFGKKDIITDKISYDFADSCRRDESQCGQSGKYFYEEKNINFKVIKHTLTVNSPYFLVLFVYLIYIVQIIKTNK